MLYERLIIDKFTVAVHNFEVIPITLVILDQEYIKQEWIHFSVQLGLGGWGGCVCLEWRGDIFWTLN